jgi:hypothetical protein
MANNRPIQSVVLHTFKPTYITSAQCRIEKLQGVTKLQLLKYYQNYKA